MDIAARQPGSARPCAYPLLFLKRPGINSSKRWSEVAWLQFDAQAGHDQVGHRPALVISPAIYNGKTGLMICCPMSTKIKGHPFEVVTEVDGIECAVLSDQVKSLDWKIRRAKKKATVSTEVMLHVRAKMKALLQIPGIPPSTGRMDF